MVREAEIRALELLTRPLPDLLTRLVRVAAQVSGTQEARLNVVTAGEQHTIVSATGPPESIPREASLCARLLEGQLPQVVSDVRTMPELAGVPAVADGEVVTYAGQPLVTDNGVAIGVLCVYDSSERSITEPTTEILAELAAAIMEVLEARRHQDELGSAVSRLTRGTRELRRSNQDLAAFAGQVSHDILGPLSALLLSLQLMAEEAELAPELEELLRHAVAGGQRMRTTVTSLLEYAVVGGTLRRERLDAGALVADVLVDLSAQLDRATVTVDDLPPVWGDEVQVRAVLQNLLANALKYGGAEPRVRVYAETRPACPRIVVADAGPGVPEDQREAIFALHVRGGQRPQDAQGVGIGLATCRRIVDAHGGRLGVETSAEGGAAFWFELPEPPVTHT